MARGEQRHRRQLNCGLDLSEVVMALTMQEALLALTKYWTDRGCIIAQPFNTDAKPVVPIRVDDEICAVAVDDCADVGACECPARLLGECSARHRIGGSAPTDSPLHDSVDDPCPDRRSLRPIPLIVP